MNPCYNAILIFAVSQPKFTQMTNENTDLDCSITSRSEAANIVHLHLGGVEGKWE